ncbi:hypothetical protein GBA52_026200 [Prunus armeniaca]|nr:hypothetical protein GBA52_026200 [Prunus armeniaca]
MKIPLLNAFEGGVRVAVGKSNWWRGWLRMGEGYVDVGVMAVVLTVGFSPKEEVGGGGVQRGHGVGMS